MCILFNASSSFFIVLLESFFTVFCVLFVLLHEFLLWSLFIWFVILIIRCLFALFFYPMRLYSDIWFVFIIHASSAFRLVALSMSGVSVFYRNDNKELLFYFLLIEIVSGENIFWKYLWLINFVLFYLLLWLYLLIVIFYVFTYFFSYFFFHSYFFLMNLFRYVMYTCFIQFSFFLISCNFLLLT